jgi:uncharacterized membrane protein YeaQ/YmgE (transglycosylase-associated protein family)
MFVGLERGRDRGTLCFVFVTILGVIASAFITGALARLAVPGPDPMPAWLTVAIGLVGSLAGTGIALIGAGPLAASICAFVTAVLLVVGYRRFVQHRPVWGRDALRFPRRGVGVEAYRAKLRRAGIDPDRLPFEPATQPSEQPTAAPVAESHAEESSMSPEERTEALRRLAEERDAGTITADEFRERRRRIVYGED